MFDFDDSLLPKEKDSYHFVAYVPIDGRLYELDGLKEGPIDLGKCDPQDWLLTAKVVLDQRMQRLAEPFGVFVQNINVCLATCKFYN